MYSLTRHTIFKSITSTFNLKFKENSLQQRLKFKAALCNLKIGFIAKTGKTSTKSKAAIAATTTTMEATTYLQQSDTWKDNL